MKFGIQYLYWRKDLDCKSYLPYLEAAGKIGFDALELGDYLILDMPDPQVRELAAATRDLQMELTAGLDPPGTAALTDESETLRERGLCFYRRAFARLEQLGVSTLGGNMLNAPPRAPFSRYYEREWEYGVRSMRRLGRDAAQHGITMCVEVVNRFEGHIFNTARDGRRFVDEVDHPNVKLLLDAFHMNIEESDLAQAVLEAGDRLGHFHFIENHRGLPGSGHIDWRGIRDAMRQIGYSGTLVMEALVRAGGSLGDCVRIWRDLAGCADPEALNYNAQVSLAFARELFAQAE